MHLQLAGIAKIHLNHGSKQSGAFELEFGFRAAAERLRIRQLQIARKVVKRQERKLSDTDKSSASEDSSSDEHLDEDSDEESNGDLGTNTVSSPTESQLVTGTTSVPSVIPASDSLGVHTPEIPTENTPTGSTRLLRPSTLQQLGIDSITTGMGEGPTKPPPR